MKIETLIIGLGKVGMGYDYLQRKGKIKSHAQAIINNKNFKLVGGVDKNFLKRKKFKKKFEISSYENYLTALEEKKPKFVIISTPIKTHYDILNALCKKKYIKIILCEKPITDNLKKTKKILNKIKKNKIKFFTNYYRQSNLIIQETLKKNRKKILNPNLKISVNYYDSFYNNCSHFILFFLKIFGFPEKINNVKCKHKQKNIIESEINFELIFNNRIKVTFKSIIKRFKKIKYEINFMLKNFEIKFFYGSKQILINNFKKKQSINTKINFSQKNVLDDIFANITKKKKFPISIDDILNTEIILDRVIKKL